eukprot:scaffold2155_cov96-Cylindrotheca_fusiformis.AAC.6
MCGEDGDNKGEDSNPSWMGWVEASIEAPTGGPIPKDWPSAASMKALLQAAATTWDSGGLQPPSKDGLLLPPGYGGGDETLDEAVERLCVNWRRNLWNLGERNQPDMHPSAQEDLETFLKTGQSGITYDGSAFPMRIGVLILPKNRVFGAHAHPTIELEHTLRGALGEVRIVAGDNTKELPVAHRGPWKPRPGGKALAGPNLVDLDEKHSSLPNTAQWKIMTPVAAGNYLFNEVGSIHKSYTGPEDGAFMVLWGGIHATIEEEGTAIPNSDLLALTQITNANS